MDTQNKIEEIVESLESILDVCENSLEEVTESFIKDNFNLAASLEVYFKKLQETDAVDMLQVFISKHWKQKGRSVPSDVSVFEESCDLLLTACFRSPTLTCKNLGIAVMEYERSCGRSRLQDLVIHLLREGISCQLLHTITSAPNLLSTIYMGWHRMLECGQSDKVRSLIMSTLEKNPHLVSAVLQIVLKCNVNDDTQMNDVILDCVITEMKKENAKDFCSCVVNSSDANVLVMLSERYPSFCSTLLDSLHLLADGAELKCTRTKEGNVEYSWNALGFPLILLQQLCKHNGIVGSRTRSWLLELQTIPGCSVWEDIAAFCGV